MENCMKKVFLFVIFLNSFTSAYTTNFLTTDSAQNVPVRYLISRKTPEKINRITEAKWFQMTYISVPLIVTGSLVEMKKEPFRSLRNEYVPSFHHGYDDYLQYVPIFALVGMKAAGVESRSSWGRMLTSDAFSAALMATTVNVMKLVIDSRRPDGTALNSFPSGHSATAFMAATMFHKEYGVRSPWYSIGAYTVATATSVSRLLNNRHWVSDVMVGAGIGILSTELGYYFADLIFGKKGLRHPQYDFDVTYSDISSFLGLYMGFTMMPRQISLSPEINFNTSTGSTVGVEGAYYITPYVGVGAELLASSIPMKIQSGLSVPSNAHLESGAFNTITTSLGAYFSLPISKRWYLGSKLLAGYGNFQGNGVDVVWNDSETREEVRSDFLKMKHANFFNAGTGISLSFWAKKNLLAKGFLDYKVAPVNIQYYEASGSQSYQESRQTLHSLTLGASVNIVW